MKVLIFTDYFSPGSKGGGQIRAIENAIGQPISDVELSVVTTDRDLGSTTPYPNIETGRWLEYKSGRVQYLSEKDVCWRHVVALIATEKPDVIHLNSAFSPKFTLPILMSRKRGLISRDIKIVVSPHGEYAVSALAVKSMKKKLFLNVARWMGFYRDVKWHATSANELNDIRQIQRVTATDVALVPPPIAASQINLPLAHVKTPGRLRMVFLSRICSIKNLSFVLELLALETGPVELDIYGPVESSDQNYFEKCEALIAKLPSHIKVQIRGAVESVNVGATLQSYDVFILPTLGENFGYAILESLAAGCPVLISDQTPWKTFPEDAGRAISLTDIARWRSTIEMYRQMNDPDWQSASRRAREFVAQIKSQEIPFTNIYQT